MVRTFILTATVAGLAATGPARASNPLLEQAVDLPGYAMWSDSGAPGLVIGVVRGNDSFVEGFGNVRPKDDHPEQPNPVPDGRSLLRLGSVTKAFTGEVLANLVVDGRVRLTETLASHLAGVTVPVFDGRPITLLDLATHSAGLPRDIGQAPTAEAPFTWPTQAERDAWLGKLTLSWAPATTAAYSNVGFDLLADALANAAGTSYAALLQARITGPLGITDTTLTPDASQCARLMMGTGLAAPPAPVCNNTEATAGDGGLYSTGNDMVRWLRHELQDERSPVLAVSHAVYRMRQTMPAAIGFDEAGPMAGLGLAWVMQAPNGVHPMILEKSGGGGGFMSYVAFAPGRDAGVFVAVNRVNFAMFMALAGAANQVLDSLVTR
ncbi:MAG: D-alanyl-D-alanine-carboxypeptidase/endopeptidase AmpH [Acetobacteraceae bacterium]|nr:D-alanyl-D-alanine-carboxypeptidase/endopeptidase AmpH [Acetobacteraceae bacterium]